MSSNIKKRKLNIEKKIRRKLQKVDEKLEQNQFPERQQFFSKLDLRQSG